MRTILYPCWTLAALACGCTSSESPAPSAVDGSEDAGAAVSEPTAKSINGCSSGFQDQTAASSPRILNWDLPLADSPARCMKIKVGQIVRWQGLFSFHPLQPKDGDSPNPITPFSAATPDFYEISFPNAGTFGFVCGAHPTMTGAIFVVP